MSVIDLNAILTPVVPDDPCGADLEYDPAFAALDRDAQGKPEQQIGSTVVPASEPDWKSVQKQSLDLLSRTKDLRVGAHLTKALLHTSGWPGFAQGLAVLRGFVEHYWEGVHPRLDPTDDNDPTMRVNILASLSDGVVLADVRTTPLIASRALGRFSLREIEIAAGDAPPPATGDAPTTATIEGAVLDCDLATLEATTIGVKAALDAIVGIEATVGEKVDAGSSLNLGKLTALVKKAANFMTARLAQRTGTVAEAGAADGAGVDGVPSTGGGGGSVARISGEISSREDVIRMLDKISAYYSKYEPSSPVPLFMERCKRLVTMNFLDIVKDLVPDAMTQVNVLRGPVAE
jgi:type VI secretion system protein ImpA